jgi:hypothetical protein
MCEWVEVKFRVFSMSTLEEKCQLYIPDGCTFNQIFIPLLHAIIKMYREVKIISMHS